MRQKTKKGLIVVIAAPSGAGKTTVCKKVVEQVPGTIRAVTATTRPKRKEEKSGRDYFFVSEREFKVILKQKQLVEWAKVHEFYYGIPKQFLCDQLHAGKTVLLAIDVQGQKTIKKIFPNNTVSIFLLPPSWHALEERLRNRQTDSHKTIQLRLKNAMEEAEQIRYFDYVIVNDVLEKTVEKVRKIIHAEKG